MENGRQPIGPLVWATQALINRLQEGKEGDEISNDDLTQLCGKPVDSNKAGGHNLDSAIRHVKSKYAIVWARVWGKRRIRCLDARGIVEQTRNKRKSVARQTRRQLRTMATVKRDALSPEDRKAFDTELTIIGSLSLFARGSTVKRIAEMEPTHPVDERKLLEMFKT